MIRKRTSRDWHDVSRMCDQWIENEKVKMESVKTLEELKESLGKIAAWRSVLMMEDVTDAQD